MATLSTLRNVVSKKLGLDTTASGSEQILVDEWINQGIIEILLRTQCTVEKATLNTIADVWHYQFPVSILAIRDIWREDSNGGTEPVVRLAEQEIIDLHRGAASSNSAVLRYATPGHNLLLIYPTPSSAYTLHVFYVPRPTAMTSAGDDPSSETFGRIPSEFHKAIEYYALWQGGEYDESRSSQGGERFRALFESYLSTIIRPAMARKGGTHQPQVVRRRRTRIRQNDRYPA